MARRGDEATHALDHALLEPLINWKDAGGGQGEASAGDEGASIDEPEVLLEVERRQLPAR